MKTSLPSNQRLSLAAGLLLGALTAGAQPAPVPGVAPLPGIAGARGGRGLPNATAEQTQAVADMNAALADLTAKVAAARSDLAAATFAEKKDDAAIKARAEAVRVAEYNLAAKRAEEFARVQAGANRLNPEQVAALAAGYANAVSTAAGGRGGGGGARGGARGGQ